MSAASLAMLSREPELSSKKTARSLRVNQPGDSFEREADQVADTVSAGGHIPGWSLSSTGADQIQRDSNTASALPAAQPIRKIGDPQDPPQSNNYGDMLGQLAEAFLQTSAGKTIVKYLTDQPIVEDAKDFVQTPQGVLVAGSTAIAAISGLAAAHKGLPIQIPAIPLNMLHPGLKMKINVEGPLDRPTQGSLMFSFEGAPPKKKKGAPTDKERFQAETTRIAADQKQFRAGMAPHSQGPLDSTEAQQRQADEQLARKAELRRLSGILQPGATHKPGEFTPLVPGTQPLSLHMGDADQNPAAEATNKEKREEIPVQRKAESAYYNEQEAAPEVESVIGSSGRPLDRETLRYMESRIGFDFSKVRIHTDSRAAASAKSLGARAYTVGNSVVFGPGCFSPNTAEGRRLLAHELAHTVQQARSAPHIGAMPVSKPSDKFETEANEFAQSVSLFSNRHFETTVPWPGPRHRTATRLLQKYEAFEHAQFAETADILAKTIPGRAFVYKLTTDEMPKQIAEKHGVTEEDLLALNKSKLSHLKNKANPKKKIEGFKAGEEILIPLVLNEATKEALKSRSLSFAVQGISMTYEEGITMGDFYESPAQMLAAPAAELKTLLEKVKKERGAKRALDASEYDDATRGRYLDLAEKNDTHFAPSNPNVAPVTGKSIANHKTEWENAHQKALTDSQAGNKDKAFATNAFADHFLTDAFASGHLFNRRDAVEMFEGKLPTTKKDKETVFTPDSKKVFDEVAKQSFVGPVKTEFSKYETVKDYGFGFHPSIKSEARFSALLQEIHIKEPIHLEGAVAKGVHDKLNAEGVEVENAKGDKWVAKGDGSLAAADPKGLEVGRKAVAQSQLNVLDVFKTVISLPLQAIFQKVWDFVPHPTAGAGENKIKDAVASGTDPRSANLTSSIVKLIHDTYQLIISKLVKGGYLRKG
jgi:Domain of unknown function (DUF4157)